MTHLHPKLRAEDVSRAARVLVAFETGDERMLTHVVEETARDPRESATAGLVLALADYGTKAANGMLPTGEEDNPMDHTHK